MPTATPPAMRNCGEHKRANIAGEPVFNAVMTAGSAPGATFVIILLSSASVNATAAMASGFFCKELMIVVAVCCTHLASRSRSSNLLVRFWTSRSWLGGAKSVEVDNSGAGGA